jgi:hypothetical protein
MDFQHANYFKSGYMGSNYDAKRMETLANVALDCVAEEKDVRPTMSQVVERLLSH